MLQAGKGVRIPLVWNGSDEIVEWLLERHAELDLTCDIARPEYWTSEQIIEHLVNEYHWTREDDQYGIMACAEFECDSKNSFRIAVIVNKKGKLQIDYRNWWNDEA